jgi:hypothetical protein
LARSHQPVHDAQLLIALCLQARHLAPQPREVCAGGPTSAPRCTRLLAAATTTATATATAATTSTTAATTSTTAAATAAATATATAAATTASAAAAAMQRGEGLTAREGARDLAM